LGNFLVILLDTHVLIWVNEGSSRLSKTADSAIRRAQRNGGLAVSAITLWELAFLFAKGKVHAHGTVETSVRLLIEDISVRPITAEIAALAAEFPGDYPNDPSDRIIGATARAEGLTLVTRDERIRKSPLLKTLW
jgi:PIN domain nuclease of toxin-antitoxin system